MNLASDVIICEFLADCVAGVCALSRRSSQGSNGSVVVVTVVSVVVVVVVVFSHL